MPTSDPNLPLDTHVILVCREGCSSSFAARLRALGFAWAKDVVGRVAAWRAAGVPPSPYREAA